jgi:hypothetical protein
MTGNKKAESSIRETNVQDIDGVEIFLAKHLFTNN